jgi:heparosan-N-sulfate-glucuronate 5-epimerase
MSMQNKKQSLRRRLKTLPVIGFFVAEWQIWRKEQTRPCYRLAALPANDSELLPYPLDMEPLLALPYGSLDEEGVPYNILTGTYPAAYHPTTIVQYGLANWNAYLATQDEKYRQTFMKQVHWLLMHEVLFTGNAGGWPMPFSVSDYEARAPWLSALIQGNAISAFARAYRLTHEEVYLQAARRAVRTFELDIRAGGVSTSIGADGVFFEEVAVYPAAHILNGYILALIGLYDYLALTNETFIAALIQRSHVTLHGIIDEFDTGYWTRYDLLYKALASRFYHTLHTTLLAALAHYSGCEQCAKLAARWAVYKYRSSYHIAARFARYRYRFRHIGVRGALSHLLSPAKQAAFKSDHISVTPSPAVHPGFVDKKLEG